MSIKHSIRIFASSFLLMTCGFIESVNGQQLYQMPAGQQTRWTSFENPTAAKGKGGMENKSTKGHPSEMVAAGETKILMDAKGAGVIQRIWLTINERNPIMLRSIKLEMYWDGASRPAVSVPLGDFFGIGLGRKVAFQNALFSDPEGRSFNSYIPMPFRTAAKIQVVNESDKPFMLFYDVNYQQVEKHSSDVLYFHAVWRRENKNELQKDFEILPNVKGKGRYLGMNMGIITDPSYQKSWWGEGEVKIYVDGDKDLPTLNGTGTEDYIGTGWGQGVFAHQYQGCLVANDSARQWAFYRYHVLDAVYFQQECKVAIQIMGGDMLDKVREYKKNGASLIPVTVSTENDFLKLFEQDPVPDLMDAKLPHGWTNFYRQDDVSATVYFYLDKPSNELPALAPREQRIAALPEKY